MKSFRVNKYEAFSDESVREAFINPSMGKRDRPDVKRILANLDSEVPTVQNMLYTGDLRLRRHKPTRLNDPHDKKERYIIKPDYKYEQVIHHVAVQAIKPGVKYGMYAYTLGSIPDRGLHMGKRAIERWIRDDTENTRYVLKMDIRKFFPSVNHDILKRWLVKKFRDGYLLDLLFEIIDSTETGLPLGFYPSPWLANFLLQPLDHYIKEQLHVKYMTRYADDIVCFSNSIEHLHEARLRIAEYLTDELGLAMKDNWQVFPLEYETAEHSLTCGTLKDLLAVDGILTKENVPHRLKRHDGKQRIFLDAGTYESAGPVIMRIAARYDVKAEQTAVKHGRPLDYMGFVFYRNKTVLRKHIMLRMTRTARRLSRQPKINPHDASSLLSSLGWVRHTNTYGMYMEHIQPIVDIKKLKKVIGKKQKRRNQEASEPKPKKKRRKRKNGNQMADGNRLSGRTA